MQIQTWHSVLKAVNPLAKIPIFWHGFWARLFMIWSTLNISSFVTNHFTSRRLEGISLSSFKGQMIFTWKHTHVFLLPSVPSPHFAYSLFLSFRFNLVDTDHIRPSGTTKILTLGHLFPCLYIMICTNMQLFIYIIAPSSRLEVLWRKRVNNIQTNENVIKFYDHDLCNKNVLSAYRVWLNWHNHQH